MDSKLWYSRWKMGFFLSVLFFLSLFFFCQPRPQAKSEISSWSPLNFGLPLFSFLLLPLCIEKPGESYNLVGLATGQKERQKGLEKPGRSDQVTVMHGMTCSLALYQIHFAASSLSRSPVPTPGSRHRRDRNAWPSLGRALRCIALLICKVILCKWKTLNKAFSSSQAVLTLPPSVLPSLLLTVNLV